VERGDFVRRKWLVLHRHVSFGLIWRVSFFTEARRTSVYAFSARAAVRCVTVMMRGEVGSFRPAGGAERASMGCRGCVCV